MESLEFIFYIIKRRTLFFIETSNDYFRFIDGYISGSKDDELYTFFESFKDYLIKKEQIREFANRPIHLIINFLTVYNSISLDFLNRELIDFIKNSSIYHLKIITEYPDINNLIKKYED